MRHGAVVLAGVPVLLQRLGQLDHVGDLVRGVALIEVGQRLIVDELVHRGRVFEVFDSNLIAPVRPVVGLEHHFRLVAVEGDGLGDVLRPCRAVANRCATQGVEVVQRAGAVFRHPERIELREPGIHLGGSLGAGRHLELHLNAVDGELRAGFLDLIGGCEVSHRAGGLTHADALRHLAGDAGRQQHAVLIIGAAAHGLARVDVLGNGMLRKALGHDDRGLAAGNLLLDGQGGISHILRRDHATDAAEVIRVGMGNDDRLDGIAAEVLLDQLHRRLSRLRAHGAIEHDPAGVALDDRQVRHVIAAHLIDARAYLEQAVGVVVAGVLPQAGVDGVGSLLVIIQEAVRRLAPDHVALSVRQLQHLRRVDQPAHGVVVLAGISKVQHGVYRRIHLRGVGSGRLGFGGEAEFVGQGFCVGCGCQEQHCEQNCGQLLHANHSFGSSFEFCLFSRFDCRCHTHTPMAVPRVLWITSSVSHQPFLRRYWATSVTTEHRQPIRITCLGLSLGNSIGSR